MCLKTRFLRVGWPNASCLLMRGWLAGGVTSVMWAGSCNDAWECWAFQSALDLLSRATWGSIYCTWGYCTVDATAPEADVVYVMLAVEYARMALLVLLQSNAYHTRHTRATSVLVARYYTEYIESTLLKVCFLVRLFVLSLRAVPLKQKQEWCLLPSMKHSQILDSSVDAV